MASTTTGRPLIPSGTKLGRERRIDADESGSNPAQKNVGWDVSDWQSVLVTVHPSNPLLASGTVPATAQCTLRVWRWRSRAAYGDGRPDGQWFTDEDIIMSVGGNPDNGPMEWIVATKNSERMYFQCVNFVKNPLLTLEIEIGLYGLGEPRTTTSEGTPFSSGNNPENPAEEGSSAAAAAGIPVLQDGLLSNLAGDFTATYTSATVITCVGTFEESALTWMESSRVVLVGRKLDDSANETEFSYHLRGSTLDCAVNVTTATTFTITLEDNFFVATDELVVYVEGPRHRYEVTGIDGYKRQRTRDEAFTVATQSNRIEEIDPLDQRYVPDILADAADVAQATTVDFYLDMAGYRYFTMQWTPADGNFTLIVEATDEDNGTAPAACAYIDVTNAWFGAASFTASTFFLHDLPTFIKYLHIEVTRAGAVGTAAHTLFTRRGW
jgi:hypothetical protein